MASHVVARADEIPPGGRKLVVLGGRSIAVFNLDGEYHALRNRCPHQGGPLCEGQLVGAISASGPGEYEYERPGELVRCPWHAWEFDVRTGQSWVDPERTRVKSYAVEVRRVPGPYVAETYPAAVEGDYVVIELGRT